MGKRIFISIPYTHEDPKVVEYRIKEAQKYFMYLLSRGDTPIAPVIIGHFMVINFKAPAALDRWIGYCRAMLRCSDEMHILDLDGWQTSNGVADERLACKILDIKVKVIFPDDFTEVLG